MTFREITDPDDAVLVAVGRLYAETSIGGVDPTFLREQVRIHRNKNTVWHLLAIEDEDGLYGFAHVTYFFTGFAFLTHLAVPTAFRQKGLGGALLQGTLEAGEIDARLYNRPFYGLALEADSVTKPFFLARGATVLSDRYRRPSEASESSPGASSLLWLEVEPGLSSKNLIASIYRDVYGVGSTHRLVLEAIAGAGK